MAKTKGPLLSADAHGTLGDVLTYSSKRSGQQVRKYTKPLKPASAKQRGQRRLTEFLVAQWQNMSAGDKAAWEEAARVSVLNLEGYHYFLREAQRNLYLHHGLAGYWHCNEIVGGKVLDLSGNTNHGTLEPGYPANAPVLVDSYKTKFSKGLLYDGVDEYISIPHSPSVALGNTLTLILWINIKRLGTLDHFLSKGSLGNICYVLSKNAADFFRFSFQNPAGTIFHVIDPDEHILNTWYCVVATVDKPAQKLYVNGVLKKEESYDLDIRDADRILGIGRAGTSASNYAKAIIDEVSIYNRTLSADEILTRYKFGIREVD